MKEENFNSAEKELIKEAKVVWEEQHPNPIEMALFGAKWQSDYLLSLEKEDLIKTENDRLLFQVGVLQGMVNNTKNMYNEYELKKILMELRYHILIGGDVDLEKFFEQFKKK
jgi:hypothetical protein